MKRRLMVGFLIAVIALTVTVPVLAYLYRAPFTVAEANGTDYMALPVTCTADVDWMIDNGFITTATALDTRVETLGGTEQLHMMAEDRIMAFCPTLDGNSQLNWYLTTGNTPLTSFPVIVGDGGNVTFLDNANLELGDDFELEWDGYIDTSGEDDLLCKENAIRVYTDSGDIDAEIYDSQNTIVQSATGNADKLYTGHYIRYGQRVDAFPAGVVASTEFYVRKGGNPVGTAYARVRKASDDSIVGTLGTLDVSTLGAGYTWVNFTTSVYNSATQDLRFTIEYNGGDVANYVEFAFKQADLCSGNITSYDVAWTDTAAWDWVGGLYYFPIDVTVSTTVASAESILTIWADSVDFGININGLTENSTALGGASVNDNSNSWVISNVPYYNYYAHNTSGVRRITYEPDDVISGTTLVNETNPGTHDGIITWGSNPSGVTAVLGALTVPETTVTEEGEAGGYQGAMHEVEVTDWFAEPDVGVKLAASPIRPLVTLMSDYTTITEVQSWRFLGLAILLLITVVAAVMLRGHLLIAGLACGGTIAVLVQQTIWPAWTLVFIIPAIIAGVMAERTPSIG